jgi:Trk-type K+ transport system membrane component
MKIIGKLYIVLLVAAIAVILINALVDLNPESLLKSPADISDPAVSASPTLRAPVQELDANNLQDQHLTAMLSFIGFIGLMLIVVNFMRWRR